jgi:hypothetical protein
MYFRVFGLTSDVPDLAALLQDLHARGLPATAQFRGDDLGWTGGEFVLGETSVTVERYLTKEDDLRDDLNTWAGWLETRIHEPRHAELMRHVIGTKQLVTLRPPPNEEADRLSEEVCRWLAGRTDGIYQLDGRGFFAADGTPLLPDDEPRVGQ